MKVMKGYASATGWGKGLILDGKNIKSNFYSKGHFLRVTWQTHMAPKICTLLSKFGQL